jgi:hypothetical protein
MLPHPAQFSIKMESHNLFAWIGLELILLILASYVIWDDRCARAQLFVEMGSLNFLLGLPLTSILPISVFQVARIIGGS